MTVDSYNSLMSTLSTYESISPDPVSLSSTVNTATTQSSLRDMKNGSYYHNQDENDHTMNNPATNSGLSSSTATPATIATPMQRVMSIGSIRTASEGVGSVLRRVRSVFASSLDASSLRKSMSEMAGVGAGEPGDNERAEEAPLLVKV